MNLKAWYTNSTDNWNTPSSLYEKMMKLGFYDPCPSCPTEDGLTSEWKEKNFVNPPYSNLKAWIIKAIEEAKKNRKKLYCLFLLEQILKASRNYMSMEHTSYLLQED